MIRLISDPILALIQQLEEIVFIKPPINVEKQKNLVDILEKRGTSIDGVWCTEFFYILGFLGKNGTLHNLFHHDNPLNLMH